MMNILSSFTRDMAGMFLSGVSINPKKKNHKMKEGQGIVTDGRTLVMIGGTVCISIIG